MIKMSGLKVKTSQLFPPIVVISGIIDSALVVKTALATGLLLAAWLLPKAKATVKIPIGPRN